MLQKIFLVTLLLLAVGCAGVGNTSDNGEAPRMTKQELKAKIGTPDLVILDVRSAPDWRAENTMIAGAVREDPRDFEQWARKYPKENTLVLYCA